MDFRRISRIGTNVLTARRETQSALVLIVAASTFAWAFVCWTAYNMESPFVSLMMPMSASWSGAEAIAVWTMWAVMMTAMMLPSAAPMILMHRRIAAHRAKPQESFHFGLAYLLVWAVFSVAATICQWGMQSFGALTPMIVLRTDLISGIVLVVAGAVQWSPLKSNCLTICRTPAGFLATEWRPGNLGALRIGVKHAIYCIGCCWALMALLFVFGVMNLFAILLLSTIVAVEKLTRHGIFLSRFFGLVFGVWGLWLILTWVRLVS